MRLSGIHNHSRCRTFTDRDYGFRAHGLTPAPRNDARNLRPVVLGEIIGYGLGIVIANRGAESLDHLGDLGVPSSGIEERRVHLDIVEAVTGAAIALHL